MNKIDTPYIALNTHQSAQPMFIMSMITIQLDPKLWAGMITLHFLGFTTGHCALCQQWDGQFDLVILKSNKKDPC